MKKRYYKWHWRWSEIEMYIRGWYRRIRYHWFTNKKLISVGKFKRSDYWDIVNILPETVFQLFENFVINELRGPDEIESFIIELRRDVETSNHPDEVFILNRQIENLKETLRIYRALQDRKNRPDPDDVYPVPKKCHLDNDGNPTEEMFGVERPDGEFGSLCIMNRLTDEATELLNKSFELEEKYEEEDTQLAVDIVKIRRFLWT